MLSINTVRYQMPFGRRSIVISMNLTVYRTIEIWCTESVHQLVEKFRCTVTCDYLRHILFRSKHFVHLMHIPIFTAYILLNNLNAVNEYIILRICCSKNQRKVGCLNIIRCCMLRCKMNHIWVCLIIHEIKSFVCKTFPERSSQLYRVSYKTYTVKISIRCWSSYSQPFTSTIVSCRSVGKHISEVCHIYHTRIEKSFLLRN